MDQTEFHIETTLPVCKVLEDSLCIFQVTKQCTLLADKTDKLVPSMPGPKIDVIKKSITHGQALWWWTANILQTAPFRFPLQFRLVMKEFGEDILKYGDYLYKALEGRLPEKVTIKLPAASLGIADRRFVAFTNKDNIFDLETGEWSIEKNLNFIETISYHLMSIYMSQVTLYVQETSTRVRE